MNRRDIFSAIRGVANEHGFVVVAGNGLQARFLYDVGDRPLNFYMLGSMGLAPSVSLGIAMGRPDLPVIVVEGDGNALMGMGSMAMVGSQRPARFVHIVLDNSVYETTGGQPTISPAVRFTEIATGSGYQRACEATTPEELVALIEQALEAAAGPVFIRVPLELGEGRPARVPYTPPEVTTNFTGAMSQG